MTKASWTDINLRSLPEREAGQQPVALPDDALNIAVLGAYRSGTTWFANVLGHAVGGVRPYEKHAARHLLSLAPVDELAPVMVWQATFLTPCAHLVRDLSQRCYAVAIVRNPKDVVRSMVHNWGGLSDAAALARALGHEIPNDDVVASAAAVLAVAMRTLLGAVQFGSVDLVVTYEDLVRDPARFAHRVCSSNGLPFRGVSEPPQRSAVRNAAAVDDLDDLELRALHRAIVDAGRAGSSRASEPSDGR